MTEILTRNAVLDAVAKREAEDAERKAIFYELEMDAAWEASEMTYKENQILQVQVKQSQEERDKSSLRSYGYIRLANIIKRVQNTSLTKDQAWDDLVRSVAEMDTRLEAAESK